MTSLVNVKNYQLSKNSQVTAIQFSFVCYHDEREHSIFFKPIHIKWVYENMLKVETVQQVPKEAYNVSLLSQLLSDLKTKVLKKSLQALSWNIECVFL